MIALLKALGLWLLKLILGSFADGILRGEKEKAEREKDALKTQLESLESGKDLEVEIRREQEKTEAEFRAKAEEKKKTDPLGFGAYNETE